VRRYVKTGLETALKITISTLLIYYLFKSAKIDVVSLYHSFLRVQKFWVICAFASVIVSNFLGTFQWNLLLNQLNIRLPFWRVTSYYFTGLFFNNFLLSFIGGDIIRVYDVTKSSGKNCEAISTVLLDRLIGFVALSSIAFFGLLVLLNKINSSEVLYIVPAIFIGLCFVIFFLFNKSFAKRFESIGVKLTPKRFHNSFRQIYNSLNYYYGNPGLLIKVSIISIFIQVARLYTHYFLALSIGISVNVAYFFVFIPIITLLISLPITVGGFGVREWSAAVLFPLAGVSAINAVLIEEMAYLVGILTSLPGGITFVFRKHTSVRPETC
jgi:hypothetical protein